MNNDTNHRKSRNNKLLQSSQFFEENSAGPISWTEQRPSAAFTRPQNQPPLPTIQASDGKKDGDMGRRRMAQ